MILVVLDLKPNHHQRSYETAEGLKPLAAPPRLTTTNEINYSNNYYCSSQNDGAGKIQYLYILWCVACTMYRRSHARRLLVPALVSLRVASVLAASQYGVHVCMLLPGVYARLQESCFCELSSFKLHRRPDRTWCRNATCGRA